MTDDRKPPKPADECRIVLFVGGAKMELRNVTISMPAIDGRTMLPRLVQNEKGQLVLYDPARN